LRTALQEISHVAVSGPFWPTATKAIFAGWLIGSEVGIEYRRSYLDEPIKHNVVDPIVRPPTAGGTSAGPNILPSISRHASSLGANAVPT
jgi:hypothetical protein